MGSILLHIIPLAQERLLMNNVQDSTKNMTDHMVYGIDTQLNRI